MRTAGTIDAARRTITAAVPAHEAGHVKVGQRVRAFPPESRSSMYQAKVTRVVADRRQDVGDRRALRAGPEGSRDYVLEIVTERSRSSRCRTRRSSNRAASTCVRPGEKGRYEPREIKPGLQGELYTQVLDGLKAGEQVVTFGSFFIDADHKLKGF